MFDYLPFPKELSKKLEMLGAATMLVYGTSTIRTQVLYYWVLCALEENCMAPSKAHGICSLQWNDRFNDSGNCHRFDQSAIAILLAWAVDFEINRLRPTL